MKPSLRDPRSACAQWGVSLAIGLGACVVDEDLQVGDDATPTMSSSGSTASSSGSTTSASTLLETTDGTTDPGSTGAETSGSSGSSGSSGFSGSSTDAGDEASTFGGEGTETSGSSDSGGATTEACAEAPAPEASCCWSDEDCVGDQRCYSPDCDLRIPGRCASSPQDGCLDDRDCDVDEHCVGGNAAPCNSLGPDQLGQCEPDCEYDSCHPERCDEEGEPCCDPLPGDGPNYCNGGLVCGSAGCERPKPCGGIVCSPFDVCCDRCVPECRPPGDAPCAEDGRPADFVCDTAAVPFACGEETCASIGTQFCEDSTSGDGTEIHRCHDLPQPCIGHPSCACLRDFEAIGLDHTCVVGLNGELIVTPPPSP